MNRELTELRHLLHSRPELSGQERGTAGILADHLRRQKPSELITNLGGNGLMAVFNGREPGEDILLRCDIDAVPVLESTGAAHESSSAGRAHACGHDGHMAIMCGLASRLSSGTLRTGRVLLLFQPAEENGSGALSVIQDPLFSRFQPKMVFALHNLPGFPMGSVVISQGPFAEASRGLIARLKGRSSHAGEPLLGLSPAPAVASLITESAKFCQHETGILATLIHVEIGEVAFGTSPGDAVVMFTLRAPTGQEMERLSKGMVDLLENTAAREKLQLDVSWTEEFPATVNSSEGCKLVMNSAEAIGASTIRIEKPFPWSEDFGHFTSRFGGALFGLGAGEDLPPLHSPLYDFPDELIQSGMDIYTALIERTLGFG